MPKAEKSRSKAHRFNPMAAPSDDLSLDRPAFPSATLKSVRVNQNPSKGEIEDRRHILHWDEQLKPVLERVLGKMKEEYPATLMQALEAPLKKRKLKRLPKTPDQLLLWITKQINGAVPNLVADRADINKAIEAVRRYVRQYQYALSQTDFADVALAPNAARMQEYRKMAAAHFPVDRKDTPIVSRISEINADILAIIESSVAPADLWTLLNELILSVTFDLSEKTRREQTDAAFKWLMRMEYNRGEPAAIQYEDMLSILD
jgi:hypothetical protein